MNAVIIFLSKIAGHLLGLIGRGTVLPGRLALKLRPSIWSALSPGPATIYITGTTGKTSISGSLTSLLNQAGYRVANNSKGSNIDVGVLTALIMNANLPGQIQPELMVLEVDERHFKRVIKYFPGNYLLINNISRDQSARNGHFDLVWQDIKDHIPADIHLVLNADDPLSYKFSLGHPGQVSYYGLSEDSSMLGTLAESNAERIKREQSIDIIHCPLCQSLLDFSGFFFGNLGHYSCPNCDFARPQPDYEAVSLATEEMIIMENLSNQANIDGVIERESPVIKLDNPALYNIYNKTASYTLARLLGLDPETIVTALDHLSVKVKRLETFNIGGKETTVMLSKNETPVSYNQSLDFIRQTPGTKAVMIGFDVVDDRQDLKDLSWLWDIDFTKVNDPSVTKIIAMGNFAYDIALALDYAGIESEKIATYLDSDLILSAIKEQEEDQVYALLYFDLNSKIRKLLGAN